MSSAHEKFALLFSTQTHFDIRCTEALETYCWELNSHARAIRQSREA
jgi:hypothetical protein